MKSAFLALASTALLSRTTYAAGITAYSGDHCDGASGSYVTAKEGEIKCIKLDNRHSFYADANCQYNYVIQYYTGTGCSGSVTYQSVAPNSCTNINTGGNVRSMRMQCP